MTGTCLNLLNPHRGTIPRLPHNAWESRTPLYVHMCEKKLVVSGESVSPRNKIDNHKWHYEWYIQPFISTEGTTGRRVYGIKELRVKKN